MKRIINIFGIIYAVVALTVSCDPVEADRPSVILENDGLINVPFEAGEAAIIYSVDKPVEGGVLTVEIAESNTWLSAEVSETNISFTISENPGREDRSEMMTIRYTYGDESVKNYITVIQRGCEYDHVYDADFGGSIWLGNVYSVDQSLTKYNVLLETEDGIVACLDLSAPIDTEDKLPPEGEYVAFEYRLEEGYSISVGPYSSTYICQYYDVDTYDYLAIGALESYVVVEREGDIYTIRASIIDDRKGETFLVRYTGELEMDNGLVESTLTEDIDKSFDASSLGVMAEYGVYELDDNSNYWIIYIMAEEISEGQPVVYLELVTGADVLTPASLAGTYSTGTDDMRPGTFIPGTYNYNGTWYLEVSNVVGGQAYADIQAPVTSGTVTMELNADGTLNITLDGIDDHDTEPHALHVVLENVEFYSTATSAMTKMKSVKMNNR